VNDVTYYGGIVLSFVALTYALDGHGRRITVPVALGCALLGVYGCVRDSWSFGVIEELLCLIAVRRAWRFR
jgi:hypothetical protein